MKAIAVGLCSALFAVQSFAQTPPPYDWVVTSTHVMSIEATYMPAVVLFSTDAGAGSCPAGTFVRWTGKGADVATQQANAKSIYALLIAAKTSGTPVQMYGVNAQCEIRFIYLG